MRVIAKEVNGAIRIKIKPGLSQDAFRWVVNVIKGIPGRKFVSGQEAYWEIPLSSKDNFKSAFEEKDIVWECDVVDKELVPISIDICTDHFDELFFQPFPFQVLGINFLTSMKRCLLADDMGIGKTCQALIAIYKMFRAGLVTKALIVCPSTLKFQWEDEIEKFLDVKKHEINYIIIDGDVKVRRGMYDHVIENDVLFTVINYELLRNDIDIISEIDFDVIACDEIHRIKNWKSKTSEAIMKLDAPYKWGLTGTPMQNTPDELFNIFKWINPAVLGDWWKFRARYIIVGEKFRQPNMILGYHNLGELHKKISSCMLRRLKKDVAPELPDLTVTNRYVDMTADQTTLHNTIRDDLVSLLKEIGKFTVRDENGTITYQHPKANQFLGMLIMLKEVCDSPELLLMSDSGLAKHYVRKDIDVSSPKITELLQIGDEFIKANETPKAVIFTQFARMQKLVVDKLSKLGKCIIVNGSMSAKDKNDATKEFWDDPTIVFLVATDSCNYGINLQLASLLVNVDLPYNPAVCDQRNGRIHRIGSKHEHLTVINLISVGGIDERVLDVLYAKREVSTQIVENTDFELQNLRSLTNDVMNKLLSNGRRKKK